MQIEVALLHTHIRDWRAMVDVVLVDTAYERQVFNIVLSGVPERKTDLVSGHHTSYPHPTIQPLSPSRSSAC